MRLGLGIKVSLAALGLSILPACHDDKASAPPAQPASYTVGGTLSGLSGSVTLANNGGDSRTLTANGAFTFATAAATGAAYNVTVATQPANQTCTVASGAGSIAASNVTAVTVSCVMNGFMVGGTVTGLAGGDLVLRNNGANDLTRSADGAFTFTTPVDAGGDYAVTIVSQPANQTCVLSNDSGTVAANVGNVSVTCTTFRVTGVIDAAGGTLTGPDGVEVIIPAGALTQPTTIGIARSPSGWPTPLAQNAPPIGSIYELTPHDVIFNKPVLVRLPVPNGQTEIASFVSSFNQGWQYTDVTLNGDHAEMERNVFSWMYLFVTACAPDGIDPYPCVYPRGHGFATATPATALAMTSGVQFMGTSASGSAGTWAVDSSTLTALHFTMVYDAAPDCLFNPHLQFRKLVPGATPPAQLISDLPVAMDPQGNGQATVTIDAQDLDQGTSAYSLRFACTRPGRNETGGGDWITFNTSPNGVPGFVVGGSISGLTAAGLELQNADREIVSVSAGSSSFSLGTRLAAGAAYNVRVRKQPLGEVCSVANAGGLVAGTVSNVAVTCHSTTPVAQKLALVANSASNNVTIFRRNPANGALTAAGSARAGADARAVAVTPDGHFAYVANAGSNSVSSFRIDEVAATLTSIPLSTPASNNPFGLAIDPQGQYLRVANYSAHTVSSFSIDAQTGVLTSLGSNPVGLYPYSVVTHPNGNFVYVVNEVGSSGPSVSVFSVNHSTVALTSLGFPAPAPVQNPHSIAITPNGEFAYAVGAFGRVGMLSINAATGAMTPGSTTSINGVSNSESLAIHPTGAFMYVTASSSYGSLIQVFSIDSSGFLTAGAQVPTGNGSNYAAIDGAGNFLYVTNQGAKTVTTYGINSVTGDLTLLQADPTGVDPQGIALTP